MSMFDDYLEILELACSRAGTATKLAEATGIDQATFVRWRHRQRCPNLMSIQPVFDYLGLGWCEALALARGVEGNAVHTLPERSEGNESEIAYLRQQVVALRTERDKAVGQVALLRDLLREEKAGNAVTSNEKAPTPPPSSGSRTGGPH